MLWWPAAVRLSGDAELATQDIYMDMRTRSKENPVTRRPSRKALAFQPPTNLCGVSGRLEHNVPEVIAFARFGM